MKWQEVAFAAIGYIAPVIFFFLGRHLRRQGQFRYVEFPVVGYGRRREYVVRGMPVTIVSVLCRAPLPVLVVAVMVQTCWLVISGKNIVPQVNGYALVGVASAVFTGLIAILCRIISRIFRKEQRFELGKARG